MPKVSVLMPVYRTNKQYLSWAIESILSQTFTDFEFIILDDCPSEPRTEVVTKYKDSRVVYIKNEENLGISESRNKLLSLAKGEYLAIFDHDDISLPERLQKQVDYLDTHPDVGVVSANMKFIYSGKNTKYPEDNLAIKNKMIRGCVVAHTAAMIRKSVLLDNKIRWEAAYSPAEDYMLWARLLNKTMFHNIQEILVHYRNHSSNTSHLQAEKMQDRDWIIKQYIAKEFPNLTLNSYEWIYLFGIIPLLKVRKTLTQRRYSLFGFFPIFVIKYSTSVQIGSKIRGLF